MDFVFLGFMAAMIISGLVVGKLAGKKLGKAEFDERQQLARGKAYKAGFYTLLVGLLAVYLSSRSLPSGSQRIQPCCPLR